MTRQDRLAEGKKRLADGKFKDEVERENLTAYIALLEDREKNPERNCKLATKVATTETNLRRLLYDAKYVRGYGLNVSVNGVSANLRIDTGASGILINSKMAEKAGLTRLSDLRIGGIGDKGASHG